MRRWLVIFRRLLWSVAAVALVLLLLYVFVAPSLVRGRIVAALARQGFGSADVSVDALSLSNIRLSDLKLDPAGRLRVGGVAVTYDLSSLRSGRVHRLTLTGAQWDIRITENGIDLGLPSLPAGKGAPGPVDLPFDELDLRASVVTLEWRGKTLSLPIDGSLRKKPAGLGYELRLDSSVPGLPLSLSGDVTTPHDPLRHELALTLKVGQMPIAISGSLDRGTGASRFVAKLDSGSRGATQPSRIAATLEATFDRAAGGAMSWTVKGLAKGSLHRNIVGAPGAADDASADFAIELSGDKDLKGEASFSIAPGITGKLTLAGNDASFAVDLAHGWSAAGNGSIRFSDGRIEIVGTSKLVGSIPASFSGWLGFDGVTPAADVSVKLDRWEIGLRPPLSDIPALADLDITGAIEGDAVFSLRGSQFTPLIHVTLDNVTIRNEHQKYAAEGISGTLTFDGFTPLHTSGGQKITIKNANSGELKVQDGSVVFRMDRPDSILVEKTKWATPDGGIIRADSFYVGGRDIDFEVFLEDVSVREWIALFAKEHVEAEGRLYGRLPVTLHTAPRKTLTFGQGFLYAKPGTTGWVVIHDREVVERALQTAGVSDASIFGQIENTVKQDLHDRLVAALTDFEYNVLTFDFKPQENGSLLCVLQLKGKGRQGSKPLELAGLTVNIRGFDDLLNKIILPEAGGIGR